MMKKTQMILGGVALAILLFAANAAQATGYYIFNFKLTTYQQEALNWNDPEGSYIYKGVISKNKITTGSMLYALADAAGCPLPLPIGAMLGSYVGTSEADPDHGKIFFLTSDKIRITGCTAPLSETIFSNTQYNDFQATEYTDTQIPSGGLKQKWWYETVYQFRIDPPLTAFDLRGLACAQINLSYLTNLLKVTLKIPVYGRGQVGGKSVVVFGEISAKFYPTSS